MATKIKAPTTWYNYLYMFPDDTVFYVGKGQKGRIDEHEKEAQTGCPCEKCRTIRTIWKCGHPVKKRIVFETLVEAEALENEKRLIAEHDSEYLTNVMHNHYRKAAKKNETQPTRGIITELSPVMQAIIEFMDNPHKDEFVGLISELHSELLKYDVYRNANSAPKAPSKLTIHLRGISSDARVYGIDIQDTRRIERGSLIVLRRLKSGA